MRFSQAVRISLIAMFGALQPTSIQADTTAATPSTIVVSVAGPAAVHVAGTLAANARLRAMLYASPASDLPNALLSRRSFTTDGNGHFDAILPTSPAYVDGTIITVIVQTAAGAFVGRGSVALTDAPVAIPVPNHPSPPTH